MSRTLPAAREVFVAAMKRETTGAELSRLVAVLDALIKWSVARPQKLAFQDDSSPGVLAFQCVGSKEVCWSARTARGDAPKLEIYPPNGRSLSGRAVTSGKEEDVTDVELSLILTQLASPVSDYVGGPGDGRKLTTYFPYLGTPFAGDAEGKGKPAAF